MLVDLAELKVTDGDLETKDGVGATYVRKLFSSPIICGFFIPIVNSGNLWPQDNDLFSMTIFSVRLQNLFKY